MVNIIIILALCIMVLGLYMFSRAEMYHGWLFKQVFSTHPCGDKPIEMEQTGFSFVVRIPWFKP